ncbi:MAG: tRNA pseudouridine(38-40) synthase TruA [Parachlamydiales bacterium]
MPKYRITVAYDGTRYSGWQVQPNGTAIQQLLQEAAATLLRQPTPITGSGRTDAGVHAKGQVAHFEAEESPSLRSFNALLPPDIRVSAIEPAPDDFHARFSAKKKIYHYNLCTAPVHDPFLRLYSLHLPQRWGVERVREAIPHLVGERDFTSLANLRGPGLDPEDRVRNLERVTLVVSEGRVVVEMEGSGFLYKMARNLVGLLLDVGMGKIEPDGVPAILEARDRRASSASAPPHGLFLMRVLY